MIKKIISVVAGTRPNFVKVAPILKALAASRKLKPRLIHTGQHYDFGMSDVFFRDLMIPKPDAYLRVGSGLHAEQTGKVMAAFEKDCLMSKPSAVVVVGDVNSTVAAALAAVKLRIPIAHVEAGLRSFDPAMPEEHNRIVTDAVSDWLFVSEESGIKNLKGRLYPWQKAHLVGNVMIDSLILSSGAIRRSRIESRLGLKKGTYGVATIHRPSNTDDPAAVDEIALILRQTAERMPVVFPVHPRTRESVSALTGIRDLQKSGRLKLLDPLGYADFLRLVSDAAFVLTDSGGIQEETTYLGVPCLTMRTNTERPATIKTGTNLLVGRNRSLIKASIERILAGRWKRPDPPRLWDGRAAARIVRILEQSLS